MPAVPGRTRVQCQAVTHLVDLLQQHQALPDSNPNPNTVPNPN